MRADWKPQRAVEIVAGTAPGGGLDRTARALVCAIEAAGLLEVPIGVKNIPGDGARKAWSYMDLHAGDPHILSISHPNLTTDRLIGLASFDVRSYTPLATLYSEYIGFVVRADSPVRSTRELLERMRENACSLTVALSTSLGNPNHIALARVLRHAGADPKAPHVHVFDSALDAVAAVVAGRCELAAVTAASALPELDRGNLRMIALSAPERLSGALADVPLWQEHGCDCVIGAWRGVAGAARIEESHVIFWQQALRAATATEEWQNDLARNGWTECYTDAGELERFLEAERQEMQMTLNELGLLRPHTAWGLIDDTE